MFKTEIIQECVCLLVATMLASMHLWNHKNHSSLDCAQHSGLDVEQSLNVFGYYHIGLISCLAFILYVGH